MAIKKVKEIMISLDAYPHIPYWFTLRQTLIIFATAKLQIEETQSLPRTILIFDKEYKMLGFIRRRDILRGLESESVLDKQQEASDADSVEKITGILKERAEAKVIDIMVPLNETVESEDYITEAIHKMVFNEVSTVPVLENGKVVGVVRTVEMLNEITNLVLDD